MINSTAAIDDGDAVTIWKVERRVPPFFSFGDDFSANSLISNSRTSSYY